MITEGARAVIIFICYTIFSIILNLPLQVQRNLNQNEAILSNIFSIAQSDIVSQNWWLKSITGQTEPIWSKFFRSTKSPNVPSLFIYNQTESIWYNIFSTIQNLL